MSIMSLFRPSQPAAQQTPAPQVAGQVATQPNPSLEAQQVPGAAGDQTPAGSQVPAGGEVSPLDAFKDLWKNDPDATKAEQFNPSQIFQLDQGKMQEALSKVDFAKAVTAEELQAIQQGGEGAMAAFASALNKASRETMGAAVAASGAMIEKALTQAQGSLDGRINSQVKMNQVSSQLQEINPALSHPAAAPLVEAMKAQFTDKYPTASPKEIADMANKFIGGFAQLAAGKEPAKDAASKGQDDTDWGAFFSQQ